MLVALLCVLCISSQADLMLLRVLCLPLVRPCAPPFSSRSVLLSHSIFLSHSVSPNVLQPSPENEKCNGARRETSEPEEKQASQQKQRFRSRNKDVGAEAEVYKKEPKLSRLCVFSRLCVGGVA